MLLNVFFLFSRNQIVFLSLFPVSLLSFASERKRKLLLLLLYYSHTIFLNIEQKKSIVYFQIIFDSQKYPNMANNNTENNSMPVQQATTAPLGNYLIRMSHSNVPEMMEN